MHDLKLLYIFTIRLYIFPFILFNNNLYHNATLQLLSNAFSKSTNAQYMLFFFIISKKGRILYIQSKVE